MKRDHKVEVTTDDRRTSTVWVSEEDAREYEEMPGQTDTVMVVTVTPPSETR